MAELMIRPAVEADCDVLCQLLYELAEFEKLTAKFSMTPELLKKHLFRHGAKIHALVACQGEAVVGYAFYYFSVGTFSGQWILHLEDLYTQPSVRGLGLGRQLFTALQVEAKKHDCEQLDWHVLNWNTEAIAFYDRLGAERDTEWSRYTLLA